MKKKITNLSKAIFHRACVYCGTWFTTSKKKTWACPVCIFGKRN